VVIGFYNIAIDVLGQILYWAFYYQFEVKFESSASNLLNLLKITPIGNILMTLKNSIAY
jgi:hypothetical protein